MAKAKVGFVEPMLALAVTKLPEGPTWSYELKFDGYRAIGVKAAGQVRLFSRNGKDFTKRFASIARALEALPDETVIDGEIIAYGDDGRPSFNVLQNYRAAPELHLYAFDFLTLHGRDLTRKPVEFLKMQGFLISADQQTTENATAWQSINSNIMCGVKAKRYQRLP